MTRRPAGLAVALTAGLLGASCATPGAEQRSDVTLTSVRGYHVGGERVTLSNLPVRDVQAMPGGPMRKSDPNGDYEVGQLYVQKFTLASPRARYPLLLWHGGGLTGVTWEDTPDGRPGWHDFFMRQGHDTLVSDAVERGRASWARYPEVNPGDPEHRTLNQAWSMFRFGPEGGYTTDPAQRKTYPGVQFPVEAAEQFGKQFVARWMTSDAWAQKAYDALVQKECPCVILAHSQGSVYALQAALNAPDKVKAVIVVEPSAAPDLARSDVARALPIPHLVVWGDNVQQSALWQRYRANTDKYLDALKAAGGKVDLIDLPAREIRGNSHMLMMDRNNVAVASLVQDWIRDHALMK